jgi:alpha-D-xyloside xylohydrolase
MPYLFGQAVVAHEQGIPMLRPMLLEFPNDPACATLDRQYMLGESLLVAPVFQKSGEVTYYLPDGIWTHLLTGERRQGGRFYTERYDVFGLPIFLRPNRLLPLGKSTQAVDYDYGEELVLVAGALDASLSQILDLVDSRSTRFAQVIARKAGNELLLDGIRDGAGWELVELGPSGTATVGIDALPSGKRHGLSQRACRLALP